MPRVPALPVAACLALSALTLTAGGASAANGELGGGFIELLMTGSAGPTRFVARPAMSRHFLCSGLALIFSSSRRSRIHRT